MSLGGQPFTGPRVRDRCAPEPPIGARESAADSRTRTTFFTPFLLPMIDQANDLRKLVMQAAENRPDGLPASGSRCSWSAAGRRRHHHGCGQRGRGRGPARPPRVLIDADPDRADVQSLCRLRDRYTVSDVLSGRRTLGELPSRVRPASSSCRSVGGRRFGRRLGIEPGASARPVRRPGTARRRGSDRRRKRPPSVHQAALALVRRGGSRGHAGAQPQCSTPTRRSRSRPAPESADRPTAGQHVPVRRGRRRHPRADRPIVPAFLGFELPPRHWLPIEPCVSAAGREATPFVISHPAARARALVAFARVVEDALGGSSGEAAADSAPEGAIGGEPKRENQLIQHGTNADNEEDHRLVARCQSLTTA